MNGFAITILSISMALQLAAAVLALRLMRKTGAGQAWLLIAAALTLMTAHRAVTLAGLFELQVEDTIRGPLAESIALVTATLLLGGVLLIPRVFQALQLTTEQMLAEVAERKRVEEVLWENEYLLRQVLDANPNIVFLIDERSRIILANEALADFYSVTRGEMEGMTQPELHQQLGMSTDELGVWLADDQKVIETGKPLYQLEYGHNRAGRAAWYRTRKLPLTLHDGTKAVLIVSEDVNELKQTEEALRASEAKWRSLVENAPDIVLTVDRDGTILFINHTLGGLSVEETLGTNIYDYVSPEHRRRVRQSIRHVFQTGETDSFEISARGPYDTRAWYSTRVGPVKHGNEVGSAILIARDITERKRTEEQLRYHADLLAQVSDAIISSDLDFKIRSWNKAAEGMYGWEADEVMGRHATEVLRGEYKDEPIEWVIEEFLREGHWKGEVTQKRKDGTPIHVLSSTSLIRDDAGQPTGAVSVNRDITERKQAEEKLQHYTKRLEILRQLDRAILAARSPEEIAGDTLGHLRRSVPSQRASVTLFDFEAETALIFVVDADGATELRAGKQIPLGSFENITDMRQRRYRLVGDIRSLAEPSATDEQLLAEGIRSYITMPLVAQSESIGSLNLGAANPDAFGPECVEIIQEVATPLAVAIQQARLHEQVQRYADDLEQRVAERTTELQEANRLLEREIREHKRTEAAERKQRTLAEALRDVTTALNSTLDLHEVLERILANVGRVVPHDVASVLLVESGVASVARCRGFAERGVEELVLAQRFQIADVANLYQMAKTGRPLAIPDTQSYPGWVQVPQQEWLRSHAGAPIKWGDQIIGFLNLGSATSGFFAPAHAERLGAFADQAAIAIRNAQHYAQARELAALQERQRLARELHDAVSQTLWSASLIADVLPDLWEQDADKGRERLARLSQLTRGALAEMRALLLELRPASLVEVGMDELLRQLVETTASRTRAKVDLAVEGQCYLPPDAQVALYRVAQEALNNATRHAMATQIEIILRCQPDKVELLISDNGRGFDPARVPAGHLGLGDMRERAEAIHATLEITSQIDHGTRIMVVWPRSGGTEDD